MKAKDTVMSKEQLKAIADNTSMSGKWVDIFVAIAQAQAEITWDKAFKAGEDKGRRDVVDGIRIYDKNYPNNDWGNSKFRESLLWWLNSKLKDWGIK